MGYDNNFYQRGNNYPYPAQNMISSGLKGRPVSSIEEARAMQIDFDGSLFIFPDIANKKIYTKQIGMNGIAELNMYELKPIPSMSTGDYVTKEEFENAVAMLRAAINKPVEEKPAPPQQEKTNFNF